MLMAIPPTDIQILFTNYNIIAYFAHRISKINHEYPNNAVIHDCMLGHD
jgi:hypothetical protein